MDNLNAQIGPIYAVYPDNKMLNDLVESELDKPSVCSFEGMDKSKHEMWVVVVRNAHCWRWSRIVFR